MQLHVSQSDKKIGSQNMSSTQLTLVSHKLCPYVQRAIIALTEKSVPFERVYVDLSRKPDWFLLLSPLGKTPVLKVGERGVFESAVILEFLEDTQSHPLHPADALERAEHRGWIEFSSSVLADIAGLYSAPDQKVFEAKRAALEGKFKRLEQELRSGPYFSGDRFSLVDAAFGPVFRYFDVFDRISDFRILSGKPRLAAWRLQLCERQSIREAVDRNYEMLLWEFLLARCSHMSEIMTKSGHVGVGAT